MMDTIFAVSSGQPPAAIAIVRISGPGALGAAVKLAGRLPPARTAGVRALYHPANGELLDRALVLVFPGPATATGEDLVELHVHGGRAVVAAVQEALATLPGLRAAEPGEFTRRALLHGRIDLTEAEGLGDLLAAETEAQRRLALLASEGGLRARLEEWRSELVRCSALVEAAIDYADEGDVAASGTTELQESLGHLERSLAEALRQPTVERLRDGIRVVIAGAPNAGKSTLLNALVDRRAAIVSDLPGTTRDRIEAQVVRAGLSWLFVDTAGLREAPDDAVERAGIALSRDAMTNADIVLWLGDDRDAPGGAIPVHARADIPGRERPPARAAVTLSARTGAGLPALWTLLEERATTLIPRLDVPAYNARQRALLMEAETAVRAAAQSFDLMIVAEELRLARSAFDRITGRADIEGVLDALFARFCLGK